MRIPLRRALVAAGATALVSPVAASAACVVELCVSTPSITLPVDVTGDVSLGGGEGILCVYVKRSEGPPPGWRGNPDDSAPYVFVEEWAWGERNRGSYDTRVCVPACPTVPADTPASLHDVTGLAQVAMNDVMTCAMSS